jgi:A/G-specific adenine glycosylase
VTASAGAGQETERGGSAAGLSPKEIARFKRMILAYYRRRHRDLPWRSTQDPYAIFISEIMLQQTQAERVAEKFGDFLARFPDFPSLAAASVRDVLLAWQGLGYNRRALALLRAARTIADELGGRLPASYEALRKLPGVGGATASSILAFAFNAPVVFIETNIRRVFIHHFFPPGKVVGDKEILPLVADTLDRSHPARWYHALMDYGANLKKTVRNPNRRSAHYQRQPPFPGSDRQLRGRILRALLVESPRLRRSLAEEMNVPEERLNAVLEDLEREGFLTRHGEAFSLA